MLRSSILCCPIWVFSQEKKKRLQCESIVNCKECGTCIVCGTRMCSTSASVEKVTFKICFKSPQRPLLVYERFGGSGSDKRVRTVVIKRPKQICS